MAVNSITTGTPMHGGAGGCGGGGALALRVGGNLVVGPTGSISSQGGSGVQFTSSDLGPPAPGGGGSGGSILMQVNTLNSFGQNGVLNVSGGQGSTVNNPGFTGSPNRSNGGQGGHGFVRVEGNGQPQIAFIGTVEPTAARVPEAVAALDPTERDDLAGFTSLWDVTGEVFPPQWLYYEVDYVDADGNLTTYSDINGGTPANSDLLPVRIYFQGRTDDPISGGKTDPGPWRDFLNSQRGQTIAVEGATEVRYMVIFNDTTPNANGDVPAVTRVAVYYRS
jgi:hypothetical protein